MNEEIKKANVGILTFPICGAGNIPLSNLVEIIHSLSNDLHLITGNDGSAFFKRDKRIHTHEINHEGGKSGFTRILKYIYGQLRISYELVKVTRNVNLWIFFIGGDTLVLPMITARLLRKNVVLAFAASATMLYEAQNDIFSKPLAILSKINCTLSSGLIIYSKKLIDEWGLEKYKNKIHIAHEHFLDFDTFKIKKKFDERDNLIGYIGRLSEEKGVLNFVEAIPRIINERDCFDVLIGGDGQLYAEVKNYVDRNGVSDKVKFMGWIAHDELPDYLNNIKLLVLPSYTEGLPNIMLEAMACGTLVLATPVGAIPDIITDGETGFLMENNSPDCIAENIDRVLDHPNLEQIARNARALIEGEFKFEKTVERYERVLEEL